VRGVFEVTIGFLGTGRGLASNEGIVPMTTLRRSTVVAGAIIALALICGIASAQDGQRGPGLLGPGWGPGAMMGPGGFGFMCNPRAVGFAEWRIDRIEAAVRPTEAQRAALNELRAASTKAAETIATACPADFPSKATERLRLMETRLEAMLQAVKTVRPAFDTFYGSLDDQQKARLDAAGPRRWGWHHRRWSWNER
jgi:hypothetical protein